MFLAVALVGGENGNAVCLWKSDSQLKNHTQRTVTLHCCKALSNINRKMENSTPCKMVTPENKFHFETWHT